MECVLVSGKNAQNKMDWTGPQLWSSSNENLITKSANTLKSRT